MATPVWPASLPQTLRLGLHGAGIDDRIVFESDSGPPRVAVHTTASGKIWTPAPMVMGETQWGLLETFYETTLFRGVRAFEWTNPWPGAGVKTFRFADRPSETWDTVAVPLPAAASSSQVWRAGGAASQRIVAVQFRLLDLPWFPAS